MITVKAPCPVCQKPVKAESFKGNFHVGCVGDGHCVQLYRFEGPEEAAKAWDKLFLVGEVPLQ